jgi:pectin methylesterase-like acyl-CoA thioesterase
MQWTTALQTFKQETAQLLTSCTTKALTLPPNTVQVWPGGATFSTIQAAINSIVNPIPGVQYQIAVGPGTYSENVVMIPNIYIAGAGAGATTVTAAGQQSFASGVVNTAENGGLAEMSIIATGAGWGSCPIGIKIAGNGKFHVSGVMIKATDSGTDGNNIRCISNNTGGTGQVVIGQSKLLAETTGNSSVIVLIESFYKDMTYFIELSDLSGTSNYSFGVSTAVQSSAVLTDCTVEATTWALYNSDQASPITANQCKIIGPVSAGVVVNN